MGARIRAGATHLAQPSLGLAHSARSRHQAAPANIFSHAACWARRSAPRSAHRCLFATVAAAWPLRAAQRPTPRSGTTPQRAGEAAWHRRARRQRGAARTLLRVAAAAGLVAAHHSSPSSSPMGGGRRRQGGGGLSQDAGAGGGGDGRIDQVLQALRLQHAQQQRLLQVLGGDGDRRGWQGQRQRDGGDGAAGDPSTGGSWRRGGGQGGAGGTRARPGDWTCPQCGAFPCFARAERCFKCRTPRRGRAAAGDPWPGGGGGAGRPNGLAGGTDKSTYLGPVGANGTRPLLGGRAVGGGGGTAGGAPTYRVPGASVAARAEAERLTHPPNNAGRRSTDATKEAANDGQGASRTVCGAPGARTVNTQAAAGKPPLQCRNSWAALAEEEEDIDHCDIDEGADKGGDGGDDDRGQRQEERDEGDAGQADADGPSVAQLRAIWQAHCNVVRKLERDRATVPPEVIASVKAQRDAAEGRWRAAKAPHPLHKRMRWAENAVRTAEAKEATRRRELQAHLDEAAAKTRELEEKLAVDVARTERKRAELGALLHESGVGEAKATERATHMALAGLGSDIGPTLAAIIERLGDGDREQGIRQDLQGLSTSLGRLEEVLREGARDEAAARRAPERYVIGDGSMDEDLDFGEGDDDDDIGDGDDGGRRVRRRDAAGTGTIVAAPRWTQAAANAPWRRATTSVDAVAEARRLLVATAADDPGKDDRSASPSDTNDLAVAERRMRLQAEAQMQAVLAAQQSAQTSPQSAHDEDQMRRRREQIQQDELKKHQEAAAKAAADAEAESARQREESWAKMSPQEREAAIRVREQQAAVGVHVFGTQAASHLAGLVHQSHVHERALADAAAEAEQVELLMQMSPEEFARWDQERQSLL